MSDVIYKYDVYNEECQDNVDTIYSSNLKHTKQKENNPQQQNL